MLVFDQMRITLMLNYAIKPGEISRRRIGELKRSTYGNEVCHHGPC